MKHIHVLLAIFTSLIIGGCAQSQVRGIPSSDLAPMADNNDWIAVSGTIVRAQPSSFVLDHGDGLIFVEMDDWDWFPEGKNLLENDRVIVYGYIDDDFLEKRKIEASSVYVKNLGTQFYASGVDEEDFVTSTQGSNEPKIEIRGTVTSISANEFKIAFAGTMLDVNVMDMPYNPLDDEGFQKLRVGDRVRVTGDLGYHLFNDLDLMADTVVTIKKTDRTKS